MPGLDRADESCNQSTLILFNVASDGCPIAGGAPLPGIAYSLPVNCRTSSLSGPNFSV